MNSMNSMLGPYRVLDIADEKGYLCGKMLGDMGADVIKIEPPGGDPGRRIPPFYLDSCDPQQSLYWFAFNTSKRSITLDISHPQGKELFRKLVKTADFVIETATPGYLESLRLGYKDLSRLNPRVIMTSITGFGQTGPYSQYKISDIVAEAMGGLMFLQGYPDRAPLRFSVEQAYLQAGAQAAMGTMIAHNWRLRSGEGQHVDESIQEAISNTLWIAQMFWYGAKVIEPRPGDRAWRLTQRIKWIYRCKDGYISWRVWLGSQGPKTRAIVSWMIKENMAFELKDVNWEQLGMDDVSQEQLESWEERFEAFFLTHTKEELFQYALKNDLTVFPMCSLKEVMENEQLESRNYWVKVEHPELGDKLTYPGAPFISTETPWRIKGRAPLIGEHNEEIYCGEMGLPKEELNALKRDRVI
ncbi:MAG: CoA transferase [Chloroflexi bacterium]|nr:CoA transferase [Chloroflexota bacterium]